MGLGSLAGTGEVGGEEGLRRLAVDFALAGGGQAGAGAGAAGRDDEGGEVGDDGQLGQVFGGADVLAGQAQAGADDGLVQTACGGQQGDDLGRRGARGGAELVADDGAGAGQGVAEGLRPGGEREQGERLVAFGQDGGGPGREVLHGGDAGHGLDGQAGDQAANGLGQVGERGVEVRVADRAEGHRARAVLEGAGHFGRGGLPGGGAAFGDAAGVVEGERDRADPVSGDVSADRGLGPAGDGGARAGHHRDEDDVGLAQHPDGLDRDQFRVTGAHAHPDQRGHTEACWLAAAWQAAAKRAATCG